MSPELYKDSPAYTCRKKGRAEWWKEPQTRGVQNPGSSSQLCQTLCGVWDAALPGLGLGFLIHKPWLVRVASQPESTLVGPCKGQLGRSGQRPPRTSASTRHNVPTSWPQVPWLRGAAVIDPQMAPTGCRRGPERSTGTVPQDGKPGRPFRAVARAVP